jgi:hypothetical protein
MWWADTLRQPGRGGRGGTVVPARVNDVNGGGDSDAHRGCADRVRDEIVGRFQSASGGSKSLTWTEQHPATSPAVQGAAMAYDPEIGKVVLFGGVQEADPAHPQRQFFNDTWTYDGITWTKQSPPTSPPARSGATMAYDPAIKRIVLFGAGEPTMTDTWTYDGTTWTEQHPATVPGYVSSGVFGPIGLSMAHDPGIGKLVLVGSETWTYDGTNWAKRSAGPPYTLTYDPPIYGPLTYDAALGKLVLYGATVTAESGGSSPGKGITWTYDGTTWTDQSSSAGLRAGDWGMAYDPAVRRTVLFGGVGQGAMRPFGSASFLNDTWTYDGRTWTQQFPATSPSPRSGALMVYDDALNSLVLYGGQRRAAYLPTAGPTAHPPGVAASGVRWRC